MSGTKSMVLKQVKRYYVRKWLNLLDTAELAEYVTQRQNKELFNKAYEGLAESMIKTFYDGGYMQVRVAATIVLTFIIILLMLRLL